MGLSYLKIESWSARNSMGKVLFGSTSQKQPASNLTREQSQFLSEVLGGIGPQVSQTYRNLLQPQSVEDRQAMFEKSFVQPAQQQLQRNIIPSIQQKFTDLNASSSSALNQALAQATTDVGTMLGSQAMNYDQQQQQLLLNVLNSLSGIGTQQTQQPVMQQRQGILGPLLKLGASQF